VKYLPNEMAEVMVAALIAYPWARRETGRREVDRQFE